jgi:hypothetical protein
MSGYEEAFGKTETPEAAPAETPVAVESVSETAPVVEPSPAQPSEPAAAPQAQPTGEQPQERDRDLAGLIKALQDEREQKRAAREEAATLKAWRAEQERKANEAASEIPHPLDDPNGFSNGLRKFAQTEVRKVDAAWQQRHDTTVEALSRNAMRRHLGAEKFGELEKFVGEAPDRAHIAARQSGDPYGWMYEKFEQHLESRKAQDTLKTLGGKSVDEIVAERLAAAKAEWEAGQVQQPEPSAPLQPERPRNPDGTFANSSQPQQRHQPPSLSVVSGAPAPRGGESRSGYDAAFRRG